MVVSLVARVFSMLSHVVITNFFTGQFVIVNTVDRHLHVLWSNVTRDVRSAVMHGIIDIDSHRNFTAKSLIELVMS